MKKTGVIILRIIASMGIKAAEIAVIYWAFGLPITAKTILGAGLLLDVAYGMATDIKRYQP